MKIYVDCDEFKEHYEAFSVPYAFTREIECSEEWYKEYKEACKIYRSFQDRLRSVHCAPPGPVSI